MKFILLAAAAAIALPAMAQTPPASTQSGTSMPDSAMPAQPTTPDPMQNTSPAPATPADTANPPGSMVQSPSPSSPMAGTTTATTTETMTPAGPSSTTMVQNGGMMGGAGVSPQPITAPTPVNPNPPVCRKGQFDGCRNGPQSTHSREVHGRSPS